MRSSTLEHWQESRNNYLSIFSYVAINFNHSPTPHSHFPHSSQSKSRLSRIDKQLIWRRHGAAEAGKAIKGLQLLRAKRFQVNVTWDSAFCHSEDLGHTAVPDSTSGARWAGRGQRWFGKGTEGWTRIDERTALETISPTHTPFFFLKTHLQSLSIAYYISQPYRKNSAMPCLSVPKHRHQSGSKWVLGMDLQQLSTSGELNMRQMKHTREVGSRASWCFSEASVRGPSLCRHPRLWWDNLTHSSFDLHHLSAAKMSGSVHKESKNPGPFNSDGTGNVTDVLNSNSSLRWLRSKAGGPRAWLLIQLPHFLPQLRLRTLSAHCIRTEHAAGLKRCAATWAAPQRQLVPVCQTPTCRQLYFFSNF